VKILIAGHAVRKSSGLQQPMADLHKHMPGIAGRGRGHTSD
jgi:hypothetical protein